MSISMLLYMLDFTMNPRYYSCGLKTFFRFVIYVSPELSAKSLEQELLSSVDVDSKICCGVMK